MSETPTTGRRGGRRRIEPPPPTEPAGGTPVDPDAAGADGHGRPQLVEGLNTPRNRKAILKHLDLVDKKAAERTLLNAEIQAAREGLKAKDNHLAAIDIVRRFRKMNENQRLGFRETLIAGLEAIEEPLQPDMFGWEAGAAAQLEILIETDVDAAERELERLSKLCAAKRAAAADASAAPPQ